MDENGELVIEMPAYRGTVRYAVGDGKGQLLLKALKRSRKKERALEWCGT